MTATSTIAPARHAPALKRNDPRSLRRSTLIIGVAMLIVGSGSAQAQQAGTKRTDLQRHDLSIPGREVVRVRVDFDPGYVSPRHTHPCDEIVYVLEGSLEYQASGR